MPTLYEDSGDSGPYCDKIRGMETTEQMRDRLERVQEGLARATAALTQAHTTCGGVGVVTDRLQDSLSEVIGVVGLLGQVVGPSVTAPSPSAPPSEAVGYHHAARVLAWLIRNERVEPAAIERAVQSARDMRVGEDATLTSDEQASMRRAFVMEQTSRLCKAHL